MATITKITVDNSGNISMNTEKNSKRKIVIETPRGMVIQTGNSKARLEWNEGFGPQKSKAFENAQEFVDSECLRRCNPFTPRRTGMLIKSGTLGTVIGSGELTYLAPYARRQYYEHKGGKGQRGSKWFERMKAAHKDSILKGAAKIIDGK